MRPIDLQVNLSQAPQAGREQHIMQSSAELAQRHGAQELDRQHAIDQTRAKAAEESDAAENRVDDHSGEGQRRQHRRGQRDQESPEDLPPPPPGRSDTSRQIDLMA